MNHATKNQKPDFLPWNHPLRTNPEAQANISKSWEKDILCLADVATDSEFPSNVDRLDLKFNTYWWLLQEIWHLLQINQSPMSCPVLYETMKKLMKISSVCGKQNIAVTYDLVIATFALQIQAQESPEFEKFLLHWIHFIRS